MDEYILDNYELTFNMSVDTEGTLETEVELMIGSSECRIVMTPSLALTLGQELVALSERAKNVTDTLKGDSV